MKILRSFLFLLSIILFISCDKEQYRVNEDAIYITLSDSLILDYKPFPYWDDGPDGIEYQYYEDPYNGFLKESGVYRLKVVYDSISPNPEYARRIIFKPILTGETRVVLKTREPEVIHHLNRYHIQYVVISN